MQKLILLTSALIITACEPPKTYISSSTPPPFVHPDYRTFIFNQSKQQTWDNLLSALADSEFEIKKLNINSYQLKVEMSGQSDKYVDCGVKTINTEGDKMTVENAATRYSYSAYHRNHLETFSYFNHFIGYSQFLVTGDEIHSEIKMKIKLQMNINKKKTSSRGMSYSTQDQEELILKSNESAHSGLLNATCRSTGKLENTVMEIMALMPGLVSPTPETLQDM